MLDIGNKGDYCIYKTMMYLYIINITVEQLYVDIDVIQLNGRTVV